MPRNCSRKYLSFLAPIVLAVKVASAGSWTFPNKDSSTLPSSFIVSKYSMT
jgi:hypothetical protein